MPHEITGFAHPWDAVNMCGICGKISYGGWPVTEEEIRRMRDILAHRGPDDAGVYLGEAIDEKDRRVHIGLGHTRLSVIDLSASGHQPMCNEDGSLWVVYNGEIYNHLSLRADLEKKGHRFRSRTDTEVILHLYEEEGIEAVRQFKGMFAFALYDLRRCRLWLCRDRIGIKPVVYCWDGTNFSFASEINALVRLPGIAKHLDRNALELYLAFGYVPAPYTIYQNILKLEPGHSLIIENGQLEKKRYWTLPKPAPKDASRLTGIHPDMICNQIYQALSEAVSSRMIADVPLGAFLSGGIDSGIVVALMARHSSRPVSTFSIGFAGDPLFDETKHARQVAKMYGTDHHEFKLIERDMLDVMPDVLAAFGEPFADSSAIPTWIVSRETRNQVTVALSGDGGDELFGGYRSYLGEYWYPTYRMIPGPVRALFEAAVRRMADSRDTAAGEHVRRLKKFINAARGDYPRRLLALKSVIPGAIRSRLLLPCENGRAEETEIPLKWINTLVNGYAGDRINTMLYTDLVDSLPGDMLAKVDWMSMRHALEVRVPFLDHRVVELAFAVPGTLKIRGMTTKYILKKAFAHILPRDVLKKPKTGFEIPISRWLKTDLAFLINDYLSRERIESQGIFNFPVIETLKSDFFANRTDTAWMLWSLVVFQHWWDVYGASG